VNNTHAYYLKQHYVILAAGQWFSPGTPDSSINKTDRHDITEILLKVHSSCFVGWDKMCSHRSRLIFGKTLTVKDVLHEIGT